MLYSNVLSNNANNKKLPWLVLLHGFLGSSADWKPYVCYWKQFFRCIAFDLPGHGQSLFATNCELHKMKTLKDVSDAIATALACKNFHILGYSMGGRIAFDMIKRYSKRILKGICISSSPGIENLEEAIKRQKNDDKLLQVKSKEDFLHRWYGQSLFAGIPEHSSYKNLILQRVTTSFPEAQKGIAIMGVGKQQNMWPWLEQNLKHQLLYICGENDTKYFNIGHRLSKLNTNIHLEVFTNSSHMPHFQQPQVFQELIPLFLREN